MEVRVLCMGGWLWGGVFIGRCGWGWHLDMLCVSWAEADLVSVKIALGSKLVIKLLQLWTVPKLL